MTYFVYLIVSNLKNNKKISYVGYTNNLKKRLNLHNSGKGAKFTRGKKWKLVYYEKYDSKSTSDGIAIYSESYYEKGWNAYIDDVLCPHFRVNYVLRGMKIPAGNHIIEFKFEPSSYNIGESLSLASSIILFLLLVFVSFKELRS